MSDETEKEIMNVSQSVCAWCGFVKSGNPETCGCEENQELKDFQREMEFELYWQNQNEFQ